MALERPSRWSKSRNHTMNEADHRLMSPFQPRRYVFATRAHGHEESAFIKMSLPLEVLRTRIGF